MILARIFTKIYKEGGIILVDAKGQKYITTISFIITRTTEGINK